MKIKIILMSILIISIAMVGSIFLNIYTFQIESVIPRIIILILAAYGLASFMISLFKIFSKKLNKEIIEKESNCILDKEKTINLDIDFDKFSAEKSRMNMRDSFEHNLERILEFIRVSSIQGDDNFTFRNGFPSYKEEMRPILEELGYTVEVNKEFIKISWKDDKKLHD